MRNFCYLQPATKNLPDDNVMRYLQLCLCSLQPHRESHESLSVVSEPYPVVQFVYFAIYRDDTTSELYFEVLPQLSSVSPRSHSMRLGHMREQQDVDIAK